MHIIIDKRMCDEEEEQIRRSRGRERSEHYTERGSPIGDRQADRQKLFESGLLFVFGLASEADCTVLLLYVDRLTALFPLPSFPLLSLSFYLPEGAHGKREMCMSVIAYVGCAKGREGKGSKDMKRKGMGWDGPGGATLIFLSSSFSIPLHPR